MENPGKLLLSLAEGLLLKILLHAQRQICDNIIIIMVLGFVKVYIHHSLYWEISSLT